MLLLASVQIDKLLVETPSCSLVATAANLKMLQSTDTAVPVLLVPWHLAAATYAYQSSPYYVGFR